MIIIVLQKLNIVCGVLLLVVLPVRLVPHPPDAEGADEEAVPVLVPLNSNHNPRVVAERVAHRGH
eukprot:CAMPEP_0206257996 /NCGR_PEP_ID=MMETSP0047_2-20121206/25669_1 /ASSEMBLY_ACC=CAM_ASM_000192 /TAXON_ID=195065 /ORGANISM="Chroomonas mesostigmatica_cf, Strain CCMP1168" /LENGTH=64 /DNA_ID=CAMNT_0053684681 /DNA_START=190 /DNA_END=381 /DNA_ORIENTATION=+